MEGRRLAIMVEEMIIMLQWQGMVSVKLNAGESPEMPPGT